MWVGCTGLFLLAGTFMHRLLILGLKNALFISFMPLLYRYMNSVTEQQQAAKRNDDFCSRIKITFFSFVKSVSKHI